MPATANLHPTFIWHRDDRAAAGRVPAACGELYRAAIDLGGSLTGEHGIGAARVDSMMYQHGPRALEMMQAIKGALDPGGILNPGRVLPPRGAPPPVEPDGT